MKTTFIKRLLTLTFCTIMLINTFSSTALAVDDHTEIATYATEFPVLNAGNIYSFLPFTFTDTNTGVYRTINGNQVKLYVQYKPNDNHIYSQHMWVYLYQYGGKLMGRMLCQMGGSNHPDSDGYYFYESDWINVDSGVDYRLKYELCTDGGYDIARRATVKLDIQVR